MHDIDRTLMELESGIDEYPALQQSEYEYADDDEYEYGQYYETSGVFNDAEEMELAAELLEAESDEELEQFFGDLIKKVGKKVGKAVKSSTGRSLGNLLKGAAKKALPIAAGAVGTIFGGPAGGAVASKLASSAGHLMGLELEGLSPEDQEFEVAKKVVKFAGEAAKKAAKAPTGMPAKNVAKAAVVSAAKKHIPGLLKPSIPVANVGFTQQSGRWFRDGNKIVLVVN